MSQANAYEQYMLELVNAERAKVGAQPLAFDSSLNTAAENHSAWMISTDSFSHTGAGGSSPGARMTAAGYTFSGSWSWGENIAWASTRAPAGLQDEVLLLHTNLMNSSGHRANILNGNYREIGIGFEVGQYGSYEGAFVTQDFASTATNPFLTGVAFDDLDGDKRYDVGEGLGNLTVSATNNTTGAVKTTTTTAAGGYDLDLAAGTYIVTFSGAGFATTTQLATIGTKNVKLDLIDPALSGGTTPPPAGQPTLTGTAGADALTGTSGADYIVGLAGSDTLIGLAGSDKLDGGSGSDKLYGKDGADILTGGAGYDSFVFDTAVNSGVDKITDFLAADDTIRLENAFFTGLNAGSLYSSAFYIGTAAHDSTDRIVYDKASGALYFDADGTGSAAAQQFAQLTAGTALTSADFFII